MKDIMIDLETMGKGPKAAIVAIGACKFDLDKGEIGEKFYMSVGLEASVQAGMEIDASTVLWWMKQGDKAREAIYNTTDDTTLSDALMMFTAFLGDCDCRIWGNGASFDNVILGSAYDLCGMVSPWEFWNDRCYRTKKAEYPQVKMNRKGTHHNALDDAVSQAEHLIEIYKYQNNLKPIFAAEQIRGFEHMYNARKSR